MTQMERFEQFVKENVFTAEAIGARHALDTIRQLRRELLAAFDRIEAQKELLERRAEKQR